MNLQSFDIFDTLIARIYYKSTDLFYDLAKKAHTLKLIHIEPQKWADLRIECEYHCRKKSQYEEITIVEIYQQLEAKKAHESRFTSALMNLEMQFELNSVSPIKENTDLCTTESILISDMYLPLHLILQMLNRLNINYNKDKVFLSSEHRKTKKNGTLYKHITRTLPSFNHWVHIGDNYHSDIKMARLNGIKGVYFQNSYPTRYEQILYKGNIKNIPTASLAAGISKSLRLKYHNTHDTTNSYAKVVSNVIAPLVFNFVIWVLETAQKLKIHHLYFLSRDGQLPYKVAKTIIKEWNIKNISCHYLYASRQAWHLPSLTKIDDEAVHWICEKTHYTSIRTILERVNIQPESVENILKNYDISNDTFDTNLNDDLHIKIKKCVKSKELSLIILENAKNERKKVIKYLNQEGITAQSSFCIVDVGWNGRLQRSLSRILNADHENTIVNTTGLYFTLERVMKSHENDRLFTYAASPFQRNYYFITSYKAVIELFFAADHGSTTGYTSSTTVEPVLRNKKIDEQKVYLQHTITEEYAKILTQKISLQDYHSQAYFHIVMQNLKHFLQNPSLDALRYGKTIIYEDQTEISELYLSPSNVAIIDLIKWIFKRKSNIPQASWIEPSLLNYHLIARFLLCTFLKFRVALKTFLIKYKQ